MIDSHIRLVQCPLGAPLGVIGKKWTLQILRDIAYRDINRFSDLSISVNGITRRMLSTRLYQLSSEGLIEKPAHTQSWQLTQKGKDLLAVLFQITAFRLKWEADKLFSDKHPRQIEEVFPEWKDQSPIT